MVIGAISLIILAVALFALYGRHLAGRWRAAYVITATLALYLNVFVLVIQSFIKIPASACPGAQHPARRAGVRRGAGRGADRLCRGGMAGG